MAETRRKRGRMGPYVSGFRTRLTELGYSPETIREMLKVVGTLGRWMERRDIAPTDLGSSAFAEFINDCRQRGLRRVPTIRSLDPLLGFLRGEGVVDEQPSPSSAAAMLLADYRARLVADRGLSEATIIRYEKLARRFLEPHGGPVAGAAGHVADQVPRPSHHNLLPGPPNHEVRFTYGVPSRKERS